jgi:excinuclease UvrABC nuclease subunit
MKKLLSQNQILKNAKFFARECGVYFLIKNSKIVYIGSSKSISYRLAQHIFSGKEFDSFTKIICPSSDRLVLEKMYIKRYMPILNLRIPMASKPKKIYCKMDEETFKWLSSQARKKKISLNKIVQKIVEAEMLNGK